MLVKMGVDTTKLRVEIQAILKIVDILFSWHGHEGVITSTYDGTHKSGSLHYKHLAIDLRLPSVYSNVPEVNSQIIIRLKEALSDAFDVLLETNHIHIEYDTKRAKVINAQVS